MRHSANKKSFTYESDLVLEQDLFDGPPSLASEVIQIDGQQLQRITGEFWTSGQRQASSIHEISYRACFKPQLPAYFIKRFAPADGVVYDPFSGRGTTAIEAALHGRKIIANDANPLSVILTRPRLEIPNFELIAERLNSIRYLRSAKADMDLSMFYHPQTEAEIVSLRQYLNSRRADEDEDEVDRWIRMVATNRLTGHSPGFFSVYTFPPNQAVSAESQRKINERRGQEPSYRDTKAIILKKTRQLLSGLSQTDMEQLRKASKTAIFLTGDASDTKSIKNSSVDLTVTSPPFLDIVQYAEDNWLRCWFNDLPLVKISTRITMAKTPEEWKRGMINVFRELHRVTKRNGVVAFEVGEVRNGKVKLEDYVIPAAAAVGFSCDAILINTQQFTKTANIWGVSNNKAGTNSNRIVVMRRLK